MWQHDRNWYRAVVVIAVLALSSSSVLASRASSSRPGSKETKAQASRSSGSAVSSRGRSSGTTTVRAGGRASWRQGIARGGYVHVPRYHGYPGWYGGYWGAYDPWYGWGWHPWYGWYGSAAWAVRSVPTFVVAARDAGEPGWIETDVRPGKARMYLDGEDVGFAKDYNGVWDVLEVSPGRHTIEFRRDGYRTLRIDVDVDGGGVYRIDRRMSRGEGEDPASVILPERTPDPTPAPSRARAGLAGESRGTAEAPPAATVRRGLLRLDVRPEDAAVYLDGEYLGTAGELRRLHGALPVAVGVHRIEVVRPGLTPETVEVEVREDGTAKVEVRLERP